MLKAVAFTVHLKNVDVAGRTIQQRAGQAFRTKDFGPFIKGQVRGHDDGAPFVALGYNSKEQFRARFAEGHKAQLVDDQQILAGQLFLKALQPALILSLYQIVHQCRCRREADFQPSLARSQPKPLSADLVSAIRLPGNGRVSCPCLRGQGR